MRELPRRDVNSISTLVPLTTGDPAVYPVRGAADTKLSTSPATLTVNRPPTAANVCSARAVPVSAGGPGASGAAAAAVVATAAAGGWSSVAARGGWLAATPSSFVVAEAGVSGASASAAGAAVSGESTGAGAGAADAAVA